MQRRQLIAGLAASAGLTCAGRVWAAPRAGARLLVVFLRGAYDAANVVIPVSSDFYYQSRPTIAVPRAAALALSDGWGLHPALRESMLPFWQSGQLAFVPFAGTDDMTRSHFETQDTIELGQPVGGTRNYASGFMGRLAHVLNGPRPIAFTDQLPLVFRGGQGIPNMAVGNVLKPGVDDRQAALIAAMWRQDPLASSVAKGFEVRDEVYASVAEEMSAASRGAASPKGLELAAGRIGRLMRDEFNLGFVDVGGWDTHVNQGGAAGYLADRIGELGRALAGFAGAIGPSAWSDTAVIVVSEFGRTFRENGDKGTDHGHGSIYWAMGGAVRGGRIAGEQMAVSRTTLNQDRDLPVLTDYRAMLGGMLRQLYGLDERQIAEVFPSTAAKSLGLI